jgi:hypothetical protein
MRDLVRLMAKSRREKPPTLNENRLDPEARRHADRGICIECARQPAAPDSYLCGDCASKASMEDIRREISDLRRRILGTP